MVKHISSSVPVTYDHEIIGNTFSYDGHIAYIYVIRSSTMLHK